MKNFNTQKTEKSTNVWLTPKYILDLLGEFDLDPCAATNRPWDCAKINWTVEDNSLSEDKDWKGKRIWLNPPYGSEIGPFLKKMANSHLEDTNTSGLALIFARTETKVFQEYVLAKAKYIFFWKGRIAFYHENGIKGQCANAPSVLVSWSEKNIIY